MTFTNESDRTSFAFTKEWLAYDPVNAIEWPADQASISVTLKKSFTAGGQTVDGDTSSYTLTKDGGVGYTVSMNPETKGYLFTLTGLQKYVPANKLPTGIEDGEWTYTLTETAPAEYFEHYFTAGSKNWQGAEAVDNGGKIQNILKTYALPSTGGSGTVWYYALGSLMVLSAGLLLKLRKTI